MTEIKEVLNLIKFNNDISIIKIEEFLEYLDDENCLNDKGKNLRASLWRKFVKDIE